MAEGPRAARVQELGSLRELTDIVFRPEMMDEYPHLFNEDNLDNVRVCVEDGRCVSHVGMTQRDVVLHGCRARVCCIGGVSTHPDHRMRGFASANFDDAIATAVRGGVDFAMISGDRKLYQMRGCLRVGRSFGFGLNAGDPPPAADPGVTVERMVDVDLPFVMECYRREPVRFMRWPSDYHYARSRKVVEVRLAEPLVIRRKGRPCAYVIGHHPHDGHAGLAEYAGDRHAILAAMPEVMERYGITQVGWRVQSHDELMLTLCEQAGLMPSPGPGAGTLKLVNFAQLMDRMRPRWEELLGPRDAGELAFWQGGDEYGFSYRGETRVVDRDAATRLLFDPPGKAGPEAFYGPGRLGEALAALLPLPTLAYGINYV